MELKTTPWKPALGDVELPPCRLVQFFEQYDIQPQANPLKHRPWSQPALQSELMYFGEFADSVWECVVAMWRLKEVEKEGSSDDVWLKHVAAWMVSPPSLSSRAIGFDHRF